MARIRSIKPEFWTDEKVVELSAFARLLFIGIWNFCDDEGRMVYSPKRLKMQIFPADSVDCSELVGEILRNQLVSIYVVDGIEYLQVNGFAKHQKIDKRSASKLPSPPNSSEFHRIPTTDQGRDQGKEGIKDQGKQIAPPAVAVTPKFDFYESVINLGADPKTVADWKKVRKSKKGANTETALAGFVRESSAAGLSIADAVLICAERGWVSINADWLKPKSQAAPFNQNSSLGKHGQATAENARRWLESQNQNEEVKP